VSALETLSLVDARDSYTAGHSHRVHGLAVALGEELGLDELELETLSEAALYHDIGKVTIPDAILLKPARLTEVEWDLMRRHSDAGARIVSAAGVASETVEAVRHHHEHYDGSGYPLGLEGDEIPLAARIIHVADALDSMLTTRVYRPGRPAREALGEIRAASGSQFCPACVLALEQLVARGALALLGLPARALVAPVPATPG